MVDFGHEPDGFSEGGHIVLVVLQVVDGQCAAFAVFEPFLADLIVADMEVPHLQRHILKVPSLVNPHAAFRHSLPQLCVAHFVYNIVTFESIKMLVMSSREPSFEAVLPFTTS